MRPEDRELLKEVLLELDEASPADRPAILGRFRLEHPELMSSLGEYVPFLDVADEALLGDESPSPPAVVGRFRIERPLGRGSMGEVYLAQEPPPMGRQVAVKLIRHGLASRQVRRRFEFERETLKSLDHENVARIIDGGTSEDGTPYVTMEYVDGHPITVYATVGALGIEESVDLVRQVCAGVDHAHLKGLVHRDLKPANVLVAERGGRPVAKIIDFGIAKLLGVAASADGTVPGTPVGTVEYMSPEQAQGLTAVVDQRSDIYSIGVILYQLLTGSLPRRRDDLLSWAGPEFLRRMADARVAPPSRSLVARGAADGSPPSRLRLREMDWITLKALEVDPDRRFRSAQEFAEDLDRFLRGEPVRAAPQTFGYRLRKWISRRPVAAGLGAASVLALAAMGVSVVASQRQTAQALVAAVRSEQAKGEALATAEAERDAAVKARDETQRVVRFLVSVLSGTSPMQKPETASVADIIEEAAARIDRDLPRGDSARMPLRMALVEVLVFRGDLARAETQARMLYADAVELKGERSVEAAQALAGVGAVLQHRGRLDESAEALESAVALLETLDAPDAWRRAAVARMRLASTKADLGRLREAIAMFEATLPVFDERIPQHPNRISGRWQLARLLSAVGRTTESRKTAEAALAIAEGAGPNSRPADVDFSKYHLAMSRLADLGTPEAAAELRAATDAVFKWLGPDTAEGSVCRMEAIEVLDRTGRADNGDLEYVRDLESRVAGEADSSQRTMLARAVLLRMLNQRGLHAEAVEVLRRPSVAHAGGVLSGSVLGSELAIEAATALDALGKRDEALAALSDAPERLVGVFPSDHPTSVRAAALRARLGPAPSGSR